MFNNPGRKIKTYATVVAVLGIIASVIGAVSLWVQSGRSYYGGGALVASGFVVLIGGVLFSWICGLMVYGLGQLIDDTQAIRRNVESK
jgi:hypothetical protein